MLFGNGCGGYGRLFPWGSYPVCLQPSNAQFLCPGTLGPDVTIDEPGTDEAGTDVTIDEPGTDEPGTDVTIDEPGTDVTIDKPGADNSDADIDFIMISDEEDNACTDIIESELTFETEVCVLTLTKRTGYLGDELVYKKDRVDREYYQFFK